MRFTHFAVAALLSASAAALRLQETQPQPSLDDMQMLTQSEVCPGVTILSAKPPSDPCGKMKAKIEAKEAARAKA